MLSSKNTLVRNTVALSFVLNVLQHKYTASQKYNCCNNNEKCTNTGITVDAFKTSALLAFSIFSFKYTSKSIYSLRDSDFRNLLVSSVFFASAYGYVSKHFLNHDIISGIKKDGNIRDISNICSAVLLSNAVLNIAKCR